MDQIQSLILYLAAVVAVEEIEEAVVALVVLENPKQQQIVIQQVL